MNSNSYWSRYINSFYYQQSFLQIDFLALYIDTKIIIKKEETQ